MTGDNDLNLRKRFNPEGSELRKHQLRMLEMLKFIDKICKENNINYWLCSGTLLGAVRHKGFIPWDDDLDIEMLREDYIKFEKVLYAHDYEYVLQTHKTDFNYVAPYGKLRDKKSVIKEDNNNDLYYKYKGIYIDIFIMEPSSSLAIYKWSNRLQHYLLFMPNKYLSNKLLRYTYIFVLHTLIHKFIFPIMRFLSRIKAGKQLRHTMGSSFLATRNIDDIFPLTRIRFEDEDFYAPGNYDSYLTKIYGDYMKLPNLDEIIPHTIKVYIMNV